MLALKAGHIPQKGPAHEQCDFPTRGFGSGKNTSVGRGEIEAIESASPQI
jgi:hypothetical protein